MVYGPLKGPSGSLKALIRKRFQVTAFPDAFTLFTLFTLFRFSAFTGPCGPSWCARAGFTLPLVALWAAPPYVKDFIKAVNLDGFSAFYAFSRFSPLFSAFSTAFWPRKTFVSSVFPTCGRKHDFRIPFSNLVLGSRTAFDALLDFSLTLLPVRFYAFYRFYRFIGSWTGM